MPAGFTYHHYLNDWECQTSTGVGALAMDGIGSSACHAWRPISPSLNFCNFSFKRKVNEYRMYDPVMSSFLSVDNYVQSPENSQNFNRYAYCLNNPLRYTDPTGWFYQGGHSGSSLQVKAVSHATPHQSLLTVLAAEADVEMGILFRLRSKMSFLPQIILLLVQDLSLAM